MIHQTFTCTGNQIDHDVADACAALQLSRIQVETESVPMSQAAIYMCHHHHRTLCYVPFNNIVEASTWGAIAKPPQGNIGFHIAASAYTTLEDLLTVPEPNWNQGFSQAVLESITRLKAEGEFLSLHVLGPFTVLTMLVDLSTCFKTWRTNPQLFWQVLSRLGQSIQHYSTQAAQAGADIISYADPLNAISILGPKRFHTLAGAHTLPFLKDLLSVVHQHSIVHLCGHLSRDLETVSLGYATPLQTPASTYDKALYYLYQHTSPPYPLLGNQCIHACPLHQKPLVYAFHI